MTDSRILPGARARLVDANGVTSREFYDFFRRLEQAGTSAAQIEELARKLGSPDGSIAGIPPIENQTITGLNPIIVTDNRVQLAFQSPEIGGELQGVTVDAYGRVSEARPVVAGTGITIDGTTDPNQIEISANALENPMTALGDLITGDVGGDPKRLPIGATGEVLTVVAGEPAWAPASGGGGSINVQDEGSTVVTGATAINFVGAGVTASASGSVAVVTIPGGGGSSPYVAPPQTGWSWVNQGGASVVDTAAYQAITGGASGAGANLRLRVRTLSPASNYTLTAAVQLTILRKQFLSGGLVLRNSSTGNLVVFDVIGGGTEIALRATRFTSPTVFSSDYQIIGLPLSSVIWLRMADNGTNRIFSWSTDGDLWVEFFTVSRTDFTTPDQIGFVSGTENIGAPNIAPIVKLVSWQIV